MAIIWTEALDLGVDSLDEQHHMLADLINELIGRIEKGEHKQGVLDAIQGMKAYAEYHFEEEERLMVRSGYAGLAEHRREHRLFADRVAAFNPGSLTHEREDAEETLRFLHEWFVDHTQDSDRRFVEAAPAGVLASSGD